MDWCRLWHDGPNDPKWRVIARKAGCRTGDVWAVFTRMLVCASQAEERGAISEWDDEDEAAALDFDVAEVTAIREAMQGRVLDGDRLSGWDRRQPKREDDSRERVRAHRQRNAAKRDVTQGNEASAETHAPDSATEPDAEPSPAGQEPGPIPQPIENSNISGDVTQCNAPEKIRGDKRDNTDRESLADRGEVATSPRPTRDAPPDRPPDEPKATGPPKRGRRLAPDWQPSADDREFAQGEGLSHDQIDRTADSFRDYWTAESGQRAAKRDWSATWRNWIRREAGGSGPHRQSPSPTGPGGNRSQPASFAEAAMRAAERIDRRG